MAESPPRGKVQWKGGKESTPPWEKVEDRRRGSFIKRTRKGSLRKKELIRTPGGRGGAVTQKRELD